MRPNDAPRTSTDLSDEERFALRQARTIGVALIVGVVMFAGIVGGISMTAKGRPAPATAGPAMDMLLTGLAVLLLLAAVPVAAVLRPRLASAAIDPATGRVEPMKFVTINLVVMALLEAPALTAVVACLVGRSMWPGGLVALAGVLAMIVFLPRASGFVPRAERTDGRSAGGPEAGVYGYREPEKWR